ncbi:MAG: SRPBCC family protein [Acidobacteria bacterium]|nr:SRPBCC family protein [Acidobacteriota bacterium]MBV9477974.1 SRPBCC family protein [Acidobacteriota bacterium]
MDGKTESETAAQSRTKVERKSDRELVVTRVVDAPARIVYDAWTKAEIFRQWWVPKSFGLTLLSCELDVRVGGGYRLVFRHGDSEMAFFGRYLEVVPPSRIVWTNEEGEDEGPVTTVTFEEQGGKTLIVLHELYPSKESLEAASGDKSGMDETFAQLDELLAGSANSGDRS